MAELEKIDGDLFWDWEDSENSQPDPDEIVTEVGCGRIVRLTRATTLPDIYGFEWYHETDDEYRTHYYGSKQEAEEAIANLEAASPAKEEV